MTTALTQYQIIVKRQVQTKIDREREKESHNPKTIIKVWLMLNKQIEGTTRSQ